MGFGKISVDGNAGCGRSSVRVSELPEGSGGRDDLPRLVVILVMLLSAVVGLIIHTNANKPEDIVRRSVERTLEAPFGSSVEGSTSIKDITLEVYRLHETFVPGVQTPQENGSETESPRPPFDARTALETLVNAENITEYNPQDMYGHGTRHFNGTLKMPDSCGTIKYAFEYWCDMKSLRAVRLIITKAERNAGIDDAGASIPKETYLNIWYY